MGVPRSRLILAVQLVGFVAVCVAAALTTTPAHWDDVGLVVLLLAFAIISDALTVQGRGLRVSGSFAALVLAMVLLGPGPAALIGVATIAVDAVRSRPAPRFLVSNLFTYAAFPAVGAWMFQALEPSLEGAGPILDGTLIVVVFMATNVLNFFLIAGYGAIVDGASLARALRSVLLPLLPSQLATGGLTACVAALHSGYGDTVIALLGVVVLVFQYLLKTALESVERADELEKRTRELARLQVGLITTVLRTLSLRDKMTARHSAAVARYAREMARALDLSARDQETIHTAALLHDIGKFIFPDSILLSSRRLTDEEFVVVKRHPEQGAALVRRIEGYEEVADIIHAHHERVDGRGYPNGLAGDRIPIGSRIIAVCDTYDVMTARDSYREPVTPAEAIAELRRVSGNQLDPVMVSVFVDLIESRGLAFRHTDDVDFEAELQFEERVRAYARPRVAAA